MTRSNIVPIPAVDSHKTGRIVGLTKEQIDRILGFEPNVDDDPDKVENSWAFSAEGNDCAVWDWKGSHLAREWSAYGPEDVLRQVFGTNYVPGAYGGGW